MVASEQDKAGSSELEECICRTFICGLMSFYV